MEDHCRAVLLDCGHNGGGIAEIDGDHLNGFSCGFEIRVGARIALALSTKNLDAATNEILSEVRTVLAADPCNECFTVGHPAIVPSEAPFNDAGAWT